MKTEPLDTRPRRSLRRLAVGVVALAGWALATCTGCALPGKLYRVAPGISGTFSGISSDPSSDSAPSREARLRLVVLHRESKQLHQQQTVGLAPDGRFRFEPTRLAIAGHEFSKFYRLYLHLEQDGRDVVVWRAQLSRLALEGELELRCDADRPLALGQVCRVEDPLEQPWLLAEGRRSFDRLCARCHGAGGRPDPSRLAPSLTAPPPDLRTLAERRGGRFERDWVARRIEGRTLSEGHRGGAMPVWGERLSSEFERFAEGDDLIGATLDPLVAYLASIQRPLIE